MLQVRTKNQLVGIRPRCIKGNLVAARGWLRLASASIAVTSTKSSGFQFHVDFTQTKCEQTPSPLSHYAAFARSCGLFVRQEYTTERVKLEVMRDKMVEDLEKRGINPKVS